jgi:hypothetical protein
MIPSPSGVRVGPRLVRLLMHDLPKKGAEKLRRDCLFEKTIAVLESTAGSHRSTRESPTKQRNRWSVWSGLSIDISMRRSTQAVKFARSPRPDR